jgi:hypothetical protein
VTITARLALLVIWVSRSRNLPVGDAGEHAPEAASASAARWAATGLFASFGPCLGKVEVLDDDGPRAVPLGGCDEGTDGRPQPPVASRGGQAGQVQADGGGGADDVPVRRDDRGGKMARIHVDRHHRVPPQFL